MGYNRHRSRPRVRAQVADKTRRDVGELVTIAVPYGSRSYYDAVNLAGAVAIPIEPGLSWGQARLRLDACDGLLLTGGQDVDPREYGIDTVVCTDVDGEGLMELDDSPRARRDVEELKLFARAMEHDIPIMGVCRGHQLINVALGGTLINDIPTDVGKEVRHLTGFEWKFGHQIELYGPSCLSVAFDTIEKVRVNSVHHQAIDTLAPDLIVTAVTADDVIESVEYIDPARFLLGVQFHPEAMNNQPARKLFAQFIGAARIYAAGED